MDVLLLDQHTRPVRRDAAATLISTVELSNTESIVLLKMSNTKDGERIVTVTEKGQATIPKSLREKHGITAPGRVKFVESEDGEIVVRPVGTMREFRGLERTGGEDRSATELLQEERERDERGNEELVERLTDSGADGEDDRAADEDDQAADEDGPSDD